MMIIFGGKSAGGDETFNETWGFRRHLSGKWSWLKAPYHPNGSTPKARLHQSEFFVGPLMFVVGSKEKEDPVPTELPSVDPLGEGNNDGDGGGGEVEELPLEAFDTSTSEWHSVANIRRSHHSAWSFGGLMFVFGGFGGPDPSLPVDGLSSVDLVKAFAEKSGIVEVIKKSANEEDQA